MVDLGMRNVENEDERGCEGVKLRR
jgi:hypothetical protein